MWLLNILGVGVEIATSISAAIIGENLTKERSSFKWSTQIWMNFEFVGIFVATYFKMYLL